MTTSKLAAFMPSLSAGRLTANQKPVWEIRTPGANIGSRLFQMPALIPWVKRPFGGAKSGAPGLAGAGWM
jgi:hypothetical protein